jgi:hypothetical protein
LAKIIIYFVQEAQEAVAETATIRVTVAVEVAGRDPPSIIILRQWRGE